MIPPEAREALQDAYNSPTFVNAPPSRAQEQPEAPYPTGPGGRGLEVDLSRGWAPGARAIVTGLARAVPEIRQQGAIQQS